LGNPPFGPFQPVEFPGRIDYLTEFHLTFLKLKLQGRVRP